MSVSYNNYGERKLPHQDSSSSYDQGYNSQPRHYSHSVTSDGFSDISFDPYNNRQQHQQPHYGYNNTQFSPDEGKRQVLDVQRMPLNDGRQRIRDSSVESDVYSSHRAPSINSSVGRDADIESIASHHTHSTTMSYATESSMSGYDQYRYNGELYRPVAAPRKVNSQVKKLFGEIHPRMLRPEEKPIVESGEETEDTMSIDSSIVPRPAPRASMRMSKNKSVIFIEDEAIRLENARLKTILRSVSMLPRLDINGSKMVVRFEYVDKYADCKPRRDMTDYSDIDSDHGGKSKKDKNKQKDIWSHVGPVGPKPARNARSNSQRSSSKRRSSSADRSRQQHSSGSRRRSSSASNVSRRAQQSPSLSRKASQNGHSHSEHGTELNSDKGPVTITMTENEKRKKQSMIGDIRHSHNGQSICSDKQKTLKWALIIGVPSVLIIIAIAVVAAIFTSQ